MSNFNSRAERTSQSKYRDFVYNVLVPLGAGIIIGAIIGTATIPYALIGTATAATAYLVVDYIYRSTQQPQYTTSFAPAPQK